ncbi:MULTISPECIES: hypothetical protein [unclassified Rhizobacter]|uniref:hypothetical protein n=1 Tax=unclassified Rhizobacter TaxID=2640088 RepID=UPI0006FFC4FA|nr:MULTISPECIES: hypothetical protein [unclassified Rhizobacter]KQU80847.1 hypothetical protein ASC88_14970 [Rhizobacter sp. Root29]KQW04390.1 hypothetical protein ASC98_04660 [Rhizobacter sp. Root1238]KRB14479.1 hypothetical protein ASE08_08480 [Rhizobacter sp. Root16D2]
MRAYEVNCVTLSAPPPSHELITHIGDSERKWRFDIAQAVRCIERGIERYYVADAWGQPGLYLDVVREPGQPPHLRARTAHGAWGNQLLALPRCGLDCGAPPGRSRRDEPVRPPCRCRLGR